MSRPAPRLFLLLLVAVLSVSACSDGQDSASPTDNPGTVPGPPLPPACQLVTAAEVQAALGVTVTPEGAGGRADRCRYVSERRDEVEVTVDHPGFNEAVRAYRGLNPDAVEVPGVGDAAALRMAGRRGELIFVKGSARFFVVMSGPSASRDALLGVAAAAASRL